MDENPLNAPDPEAIEGQFKAAISRIRAKLSEPETPTRAEPEQQTDEEAP